MTHLLDRLSPAVREVLRQHEGLDIDVFEDSSGRVVMTAWTPWNSPIAEALRSIGCHDTCMNHPAAVGGLESEQSVSWYEPEKKAAMNENSTPEHIMQFFTHTHLPAHLAVVSKPFCDLAEQIVKNVPRNPERTSALRKLLESKDAAVRAVLAK